MSNTKVSSRITKTFDELQRVGKKALITYVTAGDPDMATTEQLVLAMERAGADIIELGVPYSDPLADGPVIQRATERSLRAGTRLHDIFGLVERLRTTTEVPLVLLVYYNSVFRYGIGEFLTTCERVGVDGLIIPDLPLEERHQLQERINQNYLSVDLIPLVAPTSHKRIASITQQGSGFVYCISSTGVTGQRRKFADTLEDFMATVQTLTLLPTAIGFGISDEQAVRDLRDSADGIIIGSAIVRQIEQGILTNNIEERVYTFVKQMRLALDR